LVDGNAHRGEPRTRVDSKVIQEILDSVGLKGAVLLFDEESSRYYSNNFVWAESAHLPASTFKIPNSIIALETGVIENVNTLLKWDGKRRSFKSWERDLTFAQAFQASCVPCYQEIARSVGVERMRLHLNKLDFGEMKMNASNLDQFWLQGESRIDQFQEIDFLERLVHHQLAIESRTYDLLREIMLIEQNDSYVLRGKTGWSVTNEVDNGWFVGYIESPQGKVFFATNVEPGPTFDVQKFAPIRQEVTIRSIQALHLF